ncbi:MAG: acylphosphatase [Nitrospirae bacterium GWF2_44_13]|nr:MAG: acylphosphatase [Nitrospirae bacterium GWF2_44_13]OGW63416.1 MAG: acylphosphatase [Nitrospirae bacterium RIFOXYA2_FULL_44_9]OGW70813.1 MAG: acylphosphatase [Nitrospirae bacterium RIFOXYC2_FULL_44_7]HBG91931.1 acylphosphatase [Nitrospiraceae bacterium]
MANARAHLLISGRVQGVFYRSFTEDVAQLLGLKGWVKNRSDGNVEAVFEGKKEDIEKAIKSCYKGPPAAKVNNIDVKWEIFKGEFDTFSVRYF